MSEDGFHGVKRDMEIGSGTYFMMTRKCVFVIVCMTTIIERHRISSGCSLWYKAT